jgi:hypothetical protein
MATFAIFLLGVLTGVVATVLTLFWLFFKAEKDDNRFWETDQYFSVF